MKKVCLIGQFPPPIHGLSKALKTLIDSYFLSNKYDLSSIDITNNKDILNSLKKIQRNDSDIFYFTISHSVLGNIRDLIILRELVKKNKKIVIHYHGGHYKELFNKMNFLQKKLNKYYLNKVNSIIVLGESLKYLFSDVVQNKNKISVCENYVEDTSIINIEEMNIKISNMLLKKKIDVLYLSNFIFTKGYFDVLLAAAQLKNENITFHFAGKFFDKKEEINFHNFIKDNDLKNIKYYGVVKGDPKRQLLTECDLFVLPTYYHIEGQPISLIEAMANGLAPITTNHAGIPDIITDRNGFIIRKKSVEDIKNIILKLSINREEIQNIAYINRELVNKKYKEIDYIKRIDNIFESL